MTLVEKLKLIVGKALDEYENAEGDSLSKADSLIITAIRDTMNTPDVSVSELQEMLNEQVIRMGGKFFSFLPFVTDLKDELSKILQMPQFSLARCLKEDNRQLKKLIINIQHMKASEVIGDKFVSKEQYDKDIKDMFQKMSDSQTALKAENELIKNEMSAIEAHNTKLVIQLKDERKRADNADKEIEHLEITLLTKNEEIALLQSEIDGFKRKFSINNADGNATPLALTPREAQSTPLRMFSKP